VRDPEALPKLHAARPAARLHSELLHARCEQLRAMLGGRPRLIPRVAQAANLHLPPAGPLEHFDLDFHRQTPLCMAMTSTGATLASTIRTHTTAASEVDTSL
jgi:hypothetical protein